MPFKIYKNDEVVSEGESPLEITGIDPDTDVSEGKYQVVRVDGDKESERIDIPAFKTLPIDVTGVTVSPKTLENDASSAGDANVTADVQPSNATNKAVTFKVEPATEGLSVNSDGRVEWTADVPFGEYTITATTDDGDKTDTCTLTLKDPVIAVTDVTVGPKTNNLETGATRQLNVTIEPSNATNQDVTYSSSDDGVATINASGLITAIVEGEATVTATVDGKSDTATVNVTDPEPDPEEGD